MANTLIQILRSYTTDIPPSLQDGELAYSFVSEKLFVGDSNNTVITIGGQYYTDIIDAATANSTPNTLVLRDENGDATFNSLTVDTSFSATDAEYSGNLSVTGTTTLTGNVISDLNVTTNIYADNINAATNINAGADIFAGNDITATETISANNGYITNDLTVDRDVTINRNLAIYGDFFVQGNTTTVNSTTVTVFDRNIELAVVDEPTDITAEGAGITIKGDTDKTFNWYSSTEAWTSSENFDLAAGKTYNIGVDMSLSNNALSTTLASFDIVNNSAETVNFAGQATEINIGSNFPGTLTIRNPEVVGANPTQNLWNTVTETVNVFGVATEINLGADTGTITVRNPEVVGVNLTQNLWNTVAETVNAFGAATEINLGADTGTTTIWNDGVVDKDLYINGTKLEVSQTVFDLANTTAETINFAGAATLLNIGSVSGNTNINNSLSVLGSTLLSDLQVSGTVTLDNALQVTSGGTGITFAEINGVLFGNDFDGFQVTAAGVEGNVLQVDANNIPFFGMLDGGTF